MLAKEGPALQASQWGTFLPLRWDQLSFTVGNFKTEAGRMRWYWGWREDSGCSIYTCVRLSGQIMDLERGRLSVSEQCSGGKHVLGCRQLPLGPRTTLTRGAVIPRGTWPAQVRAPRPPSPTTRLTNPELRRQGPAFRTDTDVAVPSSHRRAGKREGRKATGKTLERATV